MRTELNTFLTLHSEAGSPQSGRTYRLPVGTSSVILRVESSASSFSLSSKGLLAGAYASLQAVPFAGGAPVAAITAPGLYVVSVEGLSQFIAELTSVDGGSVSVFAQAADDSPIVGSTGVSGGGSGGEVDTSALLKTADLNLDAEKDLQVDVKTTAGLKASELPYAANGGILIGNPPGADEMSAAYWTGAVDSISASSITPSGYLTLSQEADGVLTLTGPTESETITGLVDGAQTVFFPVHGVTLVLNNLFTAGEWSIFPGWGDEIYITEKPLLVRTPIEQNVYVTNIPSKRVSTSTLSIPAGYTDSSGSLPVSQYDNFSIAPTTPLIEPVYVWVLLNYGGTWNVLEDGQGNPVQVRSRRTIQLTGMSVYSIRLSTVNPVDGTSTNVAATRTFTITCRTET